MAPNAEFQRSLGDITASLTATWSALEEQTANHHKYKTPFYLYLFNLITIESALVIVRPRLEPAATACHYMKFPRLCPKTGKLH
jgi:hypothetical protein